MLPQAQRNQPRPGRQQPEPLAEETAAINGLARIRCVRSCISFWLHFRDRGSSWKSRRLEAPRCPSPRTPQGPASLSAALPLQAALSPLCRISLLLPSPSDSCLSAPPAPSASGGPLLPPRRWRQRAATSGLAGFFQAKGPRQRERWRP